MNIVEKIQKGMIADKMQYSDKFNKKVSGKALKGHFNSKIESIKSDLLAYTGDLNIYRAQIPSDVNPEMKKGYYGNFSEKMKMDKSLPKNRFSYSYEYKNDKHQLSDEQCKAVEMYNNTTYKMYSAAEDMYALKAAYKMLDNKVMYSMDMREALFFGIID
jgi:hypothetical protein